MFVWNECIWFNQQFLIHSYIVASGSQLQQGFSLITSPDGTAFWVDLSSGRNSVKTDTVLTVGSWFYLVGTFHEDKGLVLYTNGVHESMTWSSLPSQISSTNWSARIGIKDDGHDRGYHVDNAVVDEFKYYYRVLDSVGK